MNAADIARACHEAHLEFLKTLTGGRIVNRQPWEDLEQEEREDIAHEVEARLRTPGLGLTLSAPPRDIIFFAVIHTLRSQFEGEMFSVSPLMMPLSV